MWSGICADFATAPPSRPSATRFTIVEERPSTCSNDAEELERPRLPDEQDERERERRVADRVHDERLLRRGDRLRPLVPEPDQQVGRETDEAPADEEEQEVPRLDEHEHREDEERHVREVPALLVVAGHVAHRVPDDEPADAGDDEHHHRRERVDEDLEADLEVAGGEPRVRGRELLALVRARRPEARRRRRAHRRRRRTS